MTGLPSWAVWLVVLIGAAGCFALKLIGLSVPDRVLARPVLRRISALLPVALLAALVGVQTFGTGHQLHVDARLAALAVAVVALLLRAPFIVVVLLAAATAAILRLVT